MIAITADLLRSAVGCSRGAAAIYTPILAGVCELYQINTPARLAAFLAQIGHESESFQFTREIASGAAYEGRLDLGNTQPGDGVRFRGRGLIQVSGRFNYAAVRDRLRALLGVDAVPDFEAAPEPLEQPYWAGMSAGDYWDSHGLNALADVGDFKKITKKINGGLIGIDDRMARWETAKQAIVAALAEAPAEAQSTPEPSMPNHMPAGEGSPDEQPAPAPKGTTMPSVSDVVDSPLTKFALAAVNPLLGAVPELVHLFIDKQTGQTVPERNAAAVVKMVSVAQQALQAAGHDAPNEQAIAQAVTNDPEAKAVVRDALMANYYQIAVGEAGGGGIAAARKADADARAGADRVRDAFKSPSLIVAVLLLPLVYMIVANLIGLIGTAAWSADARAALAGAISGSIVGGIVGYYYGQTTSRNRTPAAQEPQQ